MREFQLPAQVICMCMLYCQIVAVQDVKPSIDCIIDFPSSFFSKIQNKYADHEGQVTKKTEKYLQRLFNREKKIQRMLAKIDSTGAQQFFSISEKQYAQFIAKIKSQAEIKSPGSNGAYLPLADSVKTSLSFLSQIGLVGISKIVSIKSKFFKKTKLQLMWDFLSYQQIPRTQPVKFRIGYVWR